MTRHPALMFALALSGCDAASTSLQCEGFLLDDTPGCRARPWPAVSEAPLGEPGAIQPRVGLDSDAQPVVTWLQTGAGQLDTRAMVAELRDGDWFSRAFGSSTHGFADGLELAVAPDGRALATWTQHRVGAEETAVFVARRSLSGGWDPQVEVSPISFEDRAAQSIPLLPATGEAIVVWDQRSTTGYGVAIATAASADDPFVLPQDRDDVLSPPVLFSNAPQIAVAANGEGLITWYQSVGEELRIFVSERTELGGAFSRPSATSWISPPGPRVASHAIRNPVVAIDDRGNGIVVWAQVHPSGATGLYAAERDGLGRWTLPADIDDTFAPLLSNATCASVNISASGEAFVAWYDGEPGATSVYAAHRDASGAWDLDWPGAELISSGGPAIAPQIASGSDGEAVIVWTEQQAGRWSIFARRRNPNATTWGEATRLSDPELGDALAPAVAVGGEGAVSVAWEQGPFGQTQIYVAGSGR